MSDKKQEAVEEVKLNQKGKPKQNVIVYDLTPEMVESAAQFIEKDIEVLPEKMYDQARNKSNQIWDSFYKNHKCNFFKDRTYLERQIKEITYMRMKYQTEKTQSIFAQLGCGVGNTLFPILREYEYFQCLGCDISQKAIQLIRDQIKQHKEFEDRLQVQVCDLVKDQIPFKVKPDLISMIFVLSAIVPEQHQNVLKKVVKWMKPGSFFYFRDYGRYDFGQVNMSKKGNRKLAQNFYMKNDGVCVYYFDQQKLEKMLEDLGLVKIKGGVHCRLLENRKLGLKMYRVWVQGRFYKPPLCQFYKDLIQKQESAQKQEEEVDQKQKQKREGENLKKEKENEGKEKDEDVKNVQKNQ